MAGRRPIGGRYELGEVLGRGGMATVYLGTDTHTGQPVALKVLASELIANHPEMVERFTREAEALRALNHPNIVKVVATISEEDVATGATTHYIVMEYAGGGSLRELLDREGQLNPATTLGIALDLADALTRAHRLKIIHRDLKPANVLLAEDDTPLLTDFGIARFGDARFGQGPGLTQTGMMLGTIDYLSPEACQGEELDARTDIWAFGVILYEMLAGRRPFSGDTLAAVLTAILTRPLPDIEALRPDLPVALIDLIYRMLEKDRQERIPSVRLVGAELEHILGGVADGLEFSPHRPAARPRFVRPTPRSTGLPLHNLPVQNTPFVGRGAELSELARSLADSNVRLVTILGPGGMGKTRLALEAATAQLTNFGLSTYFVPLAPLNSWKNIVPSMAEAVGLHFYEGSEPKQQLLDYLQQKQMLLVMDNFEHVLDGAELINQILHFAPGIKVLATSREKLNLQEESRFRLEGMDFPDMKIGMDPESALEYSATRLFIQGARRARPGFELEAGDLGDVVHICRLVGGMPLGILMAAAWTEMFSIKEIAEEIDRSFDFLESELRDIPARQRSLRTVFESSWNQLSAPERKVFMKLSVFRGGFARKAAQLVAGANLGELIGLVNKSLLHRDPASGRYEIHELLRQYSGEQLDKMGRGGVACEAHCAYYTGYMEERLGYMLGPRQVEALNEIETEFKNVRQAWRWAVGRKDYSAVGRSTESLFVFSDMRSREYEGEELLGLAREKLAPGPGEDPQPAWGKLLLPWFDILLQSKGRPDDCKEIVAQAETSLLFAQKLDDREWITHSLILLGHFAEPAEAVHMYEQALNLCPRFDDSFWVRIRIGFCYRKMEEHQKAIGAFEQSYERGRENGEREKMAWSLFNIGETEFFVGDYDNVEDRWLQAKPLFRQLGTNLGVIWANIDLSLMALLKGNFEESRSLLDEALEIAGEINRPNYVRRHVLHLLGYLALIGEKYQESQRLFEEVLSISNPPAEASLGLVFAACGLGDYAQARQSLQEVLSTPSRYRTPATANLILPAAALILAHDDEKERAVELLALANHHAANLTGLLEKWPLIAGLRAELATDLGRETFAHSWERGKTSDRQLVLDALPARLQAVHHDSGSTFRG